MPRVNLYVREDDYEAYEAIVDKPRWLHRAIHDTPAQRLPLNVIRGAKEPVKQPEKPSPESKTITTPHYKVKATNDIKPAPPTFAPYTAAKLEVKPDPKEYKFPPSAASQIIKTPAEAKKIVDTPQFIDKKYTARKPGSKERHVDL